MRLGDALCVEVEHPAIVEEAWLILFLGGVEGMLAVYALTWRRTDGCFDIRHACDVLLTIKRLADGGGIELMEDGHGVGYSNLAHSTRGCDVIKYKIKDGRLLEDIQRSFLRRPQGYGKCALHIKLL